MPMLKAITTSLLLCSIISWHAAAFDGPPILKPTTHLSSSRAFALKVDPTDIYGRGPADYQLTKNGEAVWSQQLQFSLWEAVVSDSGFVAGYAYTQGLESWKGEFVVLLMSPEGKLIRQEKHERQSSRFLHASPDPLAEGILLDQNAGRFIVRVRDADINRRIEEWWVYDLAKGERQSVLKPAMFMERNEGSMFIIHAQPVPSTSLILTQWWKYANNRPGAVFALIDPKGKPVWNLNLDDDYTFPDDENTEDRIRELMFVKGAILGVTDIPSFTIHFVKEKRRATFSLEKAPEGWQVRETARMPLEPDRPTDKAAAIPLVRLEKAGVVNLAGANHPKESAFRDIDSFEFDTKGRIAALRWMQGIPHVIRVSQDGEILNDIELPRTKGDGSVKYSNLAHVGGSRFIVAMSRSEEHGVTFAVVDFDAGAAGKLADADCPPVLKLAGFEDGRFTALTCRHSKYTSTDGLFSFNAQGEILWKKEGSGYSGKSDELLSPEDISRHGANSIAVLDNVRHTVQIFDERGVFQRLLNLDETWGRKLSYPTHITHDAPAGFVVYDFGAANTVVRMDNNGRIKSEFVPRHPDKRPVEVRHQIKCSAQGQIWTCDRDSLLRLTKKGVVDLVLGEKLDTSVLSRPDHVFFGFDGRIYIADGRTKAVHVFDATGRKIGICAPAAADLTESSSADHIGVSALGEVFVKFSSHENRYVHFDRDLKRRDVARLNLDSVAQRWFFQPSGDLCWIKGFHDVYLVKGLRDTVRKISRRADGQWLERPDQIAQAPDGSIAVLAASQSGEFTVSVYTAAGDAKATFAVPPECRFADLAFDGELVWIPQESNILIYQSGGSAIGSFSFKEQAANNYWRGLYCTADGKQLWFVDTTNLTLHKYSVPSSLRARPSLPRK